MSEGFNELNSETYKMKAAETTMTIYRCAALDTTTDNQVKNPAAKETNVAGVLREATHAAGEYAKYVTRGTCWIEIASAVAVGDMLVVADTVGRVRTFAPATDESGTMKVARALEAGTSAGDLVKCELLLDTYNT